MFSETAISIEGISKNYNIYDSPRDRLMQMLTRGRKQYFREFNALRDVSLQIQKGETVGIIGRNGSGKSTLLQIICGTLSPSNGHFTAHGRIAALLELGSGFNPDFTGRENVFMNASILGLSKAEIEHRYDNIAEFADIGDFIDQPVRSYSSGMVVRLAFAVAINVDPQILVVDEALSVGDELFQRKCFSQIEAIRAKGTTILFVSHSGGTIIELCDRAVLLDNGQKLAEGAPKKIVACYQKLLYAPAEKQPIIREQILNSSQMLDDVISTVDVAENGKVEQKPDERLSRESFDSGLKPTSTISYASHGAHIKSPSILTISGQPVNHLVRGESYKYTYLVKFTKEAEKVGFGMLIKTTSGIELGGAVSASKTQKALSRVRAGVTYQIEFCFQCDLNPGTYFLNAGVTGEALGPEGYLHRVVDIAMFRVIPEQDDRSTGYVSFNCSSEIKEISSSE